MKYLLIIILFLVYPALAESQWRILAPGLVGPYVNGAITFSDGCIFVTSGAGNLMWVSADTGKTWTKRNVLTPVTAIDFVNRQKGLVIAGQEAFYTMDQGITWIELGNDLIPRPEFYGGTFERSGNTVILNGSYFINGNYFPRIYRSSDLGITWDTIPQNYDNLETPVVSKSGKVYDVGYGGALGLSINVTSDVGNTWKSEPGSFIGDSYSIAADKCDDNTIYVSNEDAFPNAISHLYVSTDGGRSFQATISRPYPSFCGSLAVSRNAVYCPTTDSGVFRSTDHGQTWRSIGGPPSKIDTRLICTINDNIVVLADIDGNVWITENSGGDIVVDHSLQASAYTYPTIASCDTLSAIIKVVNTCDSVIVNNANLTTADGSSFTLISPSLPDTLAGGATMTFILRFNPHHVAKNYTGTLDLQGITLDGNTHNFTFVKVPFSATTISEEPTLSLSDSALNFGTIATCYRDTTVTLINKGCDTVMILSGPGVLPSEYSMLTHLQFPIILLHDSSIQMQFRFYPTMQGTFNAFPVFTASEHGIQKNVSLSLRGTSQKKLPVLDATPGFLHFDTLSTCHLPQDTTATLTNKGCDTITITQGPGVLPPQFKLLPPFTLPIKIAPDSSLSMTFQFTPSGTGTFTADPLFTAVQQGLSQNISLHLEGTGKQEGGVFAYSPKHFNFKSLSICDHDSASGFVTNIGCDSLQLDPTSLFSDPDFKLTANSIQLTVKPGDTMKYMVYLYPTQKGLRQGYLVLSSNDKINTRHDTVHFTVTVTDGTVFLSSSLAKADFGAVSVCEERDTMITLQNTGCDTMIVYGVSGLGSGFGTDTKFPIIILPHTDTVIHIFTLLDTAGGKLLTTGTLTFQSNANDTLPPIILSRSFIQSTHRDVGLFLDAQAKAGGDLSMVTYDIKESPNKTFTGAGIQNVSFNLSYNMDLLTFDQTKSTNISSSDGKSFTMTGNPIVADGNGVLASVGFRVYLTKDSVTTIDMTNRTDTTSLPCGSMTLSVGGSATFDYNFLCGERSIAGFYNGQMPLKIVSLHPNPSQDEIEIDLRSSSKQNATIEIFDALGVKVFSEIKNITAGSNTIHLDTKGLSGGMYIVRAGSVSQSFLKVK